ncbi:hypothetical protein ENSA5_32550 [Enhygromyxa salina]|uniref:Uncharacterized protein n=1 Tax=Enhygromyxa salina TaxID=215803 RepID=A0A2S9XXI5_9BACT|nr:hypothetical protein [Enhygromyxa salina]PRP97562.1 hypothetical protein ENSA5_32550 [Enhygromyxa salina]
MLPGTRAKLVCLPAIVTLLVSSPVLASAPPAWTDGLIDSLGDSLGEQLASFGDEDITPESASEARFGIEEGGRQLSEAGNYGAAAELLWAKGIELEDPVLIVEAAEAWRDQARAERSSELAQTAIDRVALALDMLYFLRDGATSERWQPIAPQHVTTMIGRAEAVVTDAKALITELEQEQAAAAAAASAAEEGNERGPAKPGTGLIAGGAAAMVVGLAGAGIGVAGLARGASAQSEVEDPTVYEPEHSAAAARGRSANAMAGVGIGLAGVGIGVGAALLALGVKKRKQADLGPSATFVPVLGPGSAGLGVVGSF